MRQAGEDVRRRLATPRSTRCARFDGAIHAVGGIASASALCLWHVVGLGAFIE
jgi:hypothetical protein